MTTPEEPELTLLEENALLDLSISPTNLAEEVTGEDLDDPATSGLAFALAQIMSERRNAMLGELCDTHRGMTWGAFLESLAGSRLEIIAQGSTLDAHDRPKYTVHAADQEDKLLVVANSYNICDEDRLNAISLSGFMDAGDDTVEQRRRYGVLLDMQASIFPVGPVEGTVFNFWVSALDGLFLRLAALKRAKLAFVDWGPYIKDRPITSADADSRRAQYAQLIAQYPDWAKKFTGRQ
ncbi:MAG: hypothetical protein JWN38_380 [Candidatus Saccharibacteria bacterium]|nr:hypothetical protein [Candidatus Saccharibacteria bacterium]